MSIVRELLGLVAFVSIAAGIAGYDWRLSAIICGSLVLTGVIRGEIYARRTVRN